MTTAPTPPRRAWVEQIMGLPVSVHVRGEDPGAAAERVAALFAELRRVDAVLSPYRDDSDLNRLERRAIRAADADPALAEVARLCEEARARTGGWFDSRRLPDLRDGHPRYDPSGLVKGWAAERASGHLADLTALGWCLNAGGDVLVSTPADQPAWRIGVEHPADPARVMQVVELRQGAVATSGSTHRGAHILDPHTGRPATANRAVTVTGPTLLWADVYATAAVVGGSAAPAWLEGIDGYEGLFVTANNVLRTTTGWPEPTSGTVPSPAAGRP